MDILKTQKHNSFKFYPYSPLSIKALQYGELFFASNDELNDPYDTLMPYYFPKSEDKMERLLSFYVTDFYKTQQNYYSQLNLNPIATALSEEDLLYNDLIELIASDKLKNIIRTEIAKVFPLESLFIADMFIEKFQQFLRTHFCNLAYIVSFSHNYNDPVLWAHYADQHKGFCLIFRTENNSIKIDPKIHNILSPGFTEYALEDVHYEKKRVKANAYFAFPKQVYGESVSREDVNDFHNTVKEAYTTKYQSWLYEREKRLLYYNGVWGNGLNSEGFVKKHSLIERVFHYDKSQLTGIIFGSRMQKENKEELEAIIWKNRREQSLSPPFIFYESKESQHCYEMDIQIIKCVDSHNKDCDPKEYETKMEEYNKIMAEVKRVETRNK